MKKSVALFCAALMLGSPLASFAQPGGGPDYGPNHPDNRPPQQQQRPPQQQQQRPDQQQHYQQRSQQQQQPHGNYNQGRNGHADPRYYRNPDYRPQAGMPVPHRDWRRGVIVEPNYRGDRYWVTDWQARHLYAPPRDHRWLYVNGDYILVTIASGLIVNILAGY
ncbi:RcnB family protein [Pseudomonas nitroreducens]|uniref:Integral membrane-like protein n=1 Tax=Pseudomonas nitroreducens TaxID=46680 RepID=A0A6G6J1Z6_PSENT|nr:MULTISPECIES: RcnB family protein [Pseudomonas]MDG9853075.1 RcnB family protein [Pseudomonas nitroreducens]MDH1073155.1 RcnB family protein [Pseudomonas nitroreducens]NMZ58065.1 integral membrane-like protein [Pseudomonas nitroreducens]NMZ76899.1 integral membrane-like protein [Pseudomonas nitroreducens]NNN26212.1 integral membrane-like protein [Pseudomonas nitroreducens]